MFKNLSKDSDSSEKIWSDILDFLQNKYPDPKFISLYYARQQLGVTDTTIKTLNSEMIDGRPVIRSKGEGQNRKYALPDVQMIAQFRHLIKDLEDKKVFKTQVVEGKNKYLVMDMHEKGITQDEYFLKILYAFKESVFGDLYEFIPKHLTLEQKIEHLKKSTENQ